MLRPTALAGVLGVDFMRHDDARGSFQRHWCAQSFLQAGVDFTPVQSSLSTNTAPQTLRGMHWQTAPAAEQKLVRCVHGKIWDVALDLRIDSPTYLRWHAEELCAARGNALFIPRGVAHGFLTLTADAVVLYLIDQPHEAGSARGARWDDPAFAITWPAPPAVISDRDRDWPDFRHG